MSENTINAALRRLGYDSDTMTGHGFRAMARTVLDEVLGFRPDYIEHQLAHAVRDPNGRAYNRTAHLVERAKMMQAWADYLDGLRTSTCPPLCSSFLFRLTVFAGYSGNAGYRVEKGLSDQVFALVFGATRLLVTAGYAGYSGG